MNRNTATALIEQYFQSWIQQDVKLFLSTLSPSTTVQECYGPVYIGTEEVRQWFAEWDFTCRYGGKPGTFFGTSIFQFDQTAIVRIQEYKMEKEQYCPYQNQHSEETSECWF